ncbi:hypothetical protein AC579_2527 [Pseudocercospora musae]|uniref:Uncharacterized protein n=1 Tax=Pseudocercospora musae TaxID=113226 RepID=A0A139I401_9PEZI|nr:hypothetical protein AC579_2527 [Pseudocercospora musae]
MRDDCSKIHIRRSSASATRSRVLAEMEVLQDEAVPCDARLANRLPDEDLHESDGAQSPSTAAREAYGPYGEVSFLGVMFRRDDSFHFSSSGVAVVPLFLFFPFPLHTYLVEMSPLMIIGLHAGEESALHRAVFDLLCHSFGAGIGAIFAGFTFFISFSAVCDGLKKNGQVVALKPRGLHEMVPLPPFDDCLDWWSKWRNRGGKVAEEQAANSDVCNGLWHSRNQRHLTMCEDTEGGLM